MSAINELRKERAAAIEEMKALRKVAADAKRTMNGDETAKFTASDNKQEELRQEIERALKVEELDKFTRESAEKSIVETTYAKPVVEDKGQKKFDSFGEMLQAVRFAGTPHVRNIDPRLTNVDKFAASGASEQVPSDGGYLVQQDFVSEILKRVYSTGMLASKCRRISVAGNGIRVNALDETSRASGSRLGGILGYWAGEADQKTASKPKFRQIAMQLQKLVGLMYATDEVLEDAPALQSLATEGFAQEFGFMIDDAIVSGDGVGKPQGFRNSGALVVQAKESGQLADTIVTANIVKMRSRLWAPSRANAVWLENQEIEPQLHQLTLGAAGSNLAVYLPGGSLAGQPFDSIMGIPSMPIEQASALGDEGDLMLADLSQYLLIDKGGIKSDVSMHVRFIYDEQTFRFVYRVNGQSIWNSALTPFKGANTLSPFVTLAERA